MFAAVKKGYVILAFALCCCFALLPAVTAMALDFAQEDKVVVIDAGHGGYDGGVCGISTNTKESAVNLELSKLVGGYFESDGYKVVYTRTADEALGNTKQEDMKARIKIINSAKPLFMLSLHVNFYPSSSRRGVQVFFGKASDEPLASLLQNGINTALNKPILNRSYSCLWGDYYILANSICPSAIVECGFFSNREDEKLLLDEGYRMRLAYTIFSTSREFA